MSLNPISNDIPCPTGQQTTIDYSTTVNYHNLEGNVDSVFAHPASPAYSPSREYSTTEYLASSCYLLPQFFRNTQLGKG